MADTNQPPEQYDSDSSDGLRSKLKGIVDASLGGIGTAAGRARDGIAYGAGMVRDGAYWVKDLVVDGAVAAKDKAVDAAEEHELGDKVNQALLGIRKSWGYLPPNMGGLDFESQQKFAAEYGAEAKPTDTSEDGLVKAYEAAVAKAHSKDVKTSQEGLKELAGVYRSVTDEMAQGTFGAGKSFDYGDLLYQLAHLEYHHAEDENDLAEAEFLANEFIERFGSNGTNQWHDLQFLLGSIKVNRNRFDTKDEIIASTDPLQSGAIYHLEIAEESLNARYDGDTTLSDEQREIQKSDRAYRIQMLLRESYREQGGWRGLLAKIRYSPTGFDRKKGFKLQGRPKVSPIGAMILDAFADEVAYEGFMDHGEFIHWSNPAILQLAEDPIVDLCKNMAGYVAGLAKFDDRGEAIELVDDIERIVRDANRVVAELDDYEGADLVSIDRLFRQAVNALASAYTIEEELYKEHETDVPWEKKHAKKLVGASFVDDEDLEKTYAASMKTLEEAVTGTKKDYMAKVADIERGIAKFKGVGSDTARERAYEELQKAATAFREKYVHEETTLPATSPWLTDVLQYIAETEYAAFKRSEAPTVIIASETGETQKKADPYMEVWEAAADQLSGLKSKEHESWSNLEQVLGAIKKYTPVPVAQYDDLERKVFGPALGKAFRAGNEEIDLHSEVYNLLKYGSGFALADSILTGTGKWLKDSNNLITQTLFWPPLAVGSLVYFPTFWLAKFLGGMVEKGVNAIRPYDESYGPKNIDTSTWDGKGKLLWRTAKHSVGLPVRVAFGALKLTKNTLEEIIGN